MQRLPAAVVGEAYRSEFSWSVLSDLVDVENRMAGQEGESRGAAVVADAFERAGARDVRVEEFEIPGWWRGSSSLSVGERRYVKDHEVIALPGTPAGEVSGPLVDVGFGTREEIDEAEPDGAIAVASSRTPEGFGRWLHRMEKYTACAEAGAAGFVFRNHVEGCLPPTGEVGYHNRPGPIPAVGVSKELGERLLRRSEGMETTLSVDCRNEPATSRNVVGEVGPDTAEEVLLTAHVDAHDVSEGANDNGAGCALVAEVGRLLATVEEDLETRVRLLTYGSEEIGLYGAYHDAATRDLEDVKCVVNVDGAGNSRNLRIGTNGFEDLGDVFETLADDLDVPLSTHDTVSPHGDQWAYVEEGVPAVMASSESGESGRGWGHTHADTLDKLDVRDLRALAALLAEAVFALASEEVTLDRRSREATKNALAEGYVNELNVGGRWHYGEPLR
jgi:aminopeptidase YwaD